MAHSDSGESWGQLQQDEQAHLPWKLLNDHILNLDDEKTKAPIAAQCTAEANPQRVHAAQNDNDVPPTEANLAPLEAESKLPPKENRDEENKAPIAVQYTAQANSERIHAAQNSKDVPPIEANLAPLEAESNLAPLEAETNLPPKEGEMEQLPDTSKILLNGASPIISVNQSCEGTKDGEAEHCRKGNSDDQSNEFSTVDTEGNVRGVSNNLPKKEVVALRISGHEKVQRLRVKKDAIKVENSFSALTEDPEIKEEQEEEKREEETEKKQTEHGHPRSEKKKRQKRRKSPASEVSGPDSQWSSIGVLSLSLVCFLLLLASVYTREWT